MGAMEKDPDFVNRIEFLVRRFFERIGGAIDFAWRRGGHSQSGGRTDLSALIPQIERVIEANLRRETSRIIAPNLIELRYDYETYTRMGQKRREFLQRELSTNAYEFIYNRRYATLDRVQVKIGYDAFTRGLDIKVDYGEGKQPVVGKGGSQERLENEPEKSLEVYLHGLATPLDLRARVSSREEPCGIGRNIANILVIKDPTVSNFHAAFLLRPNGTLELADRASANGTYVNGVLIGTGDRMIVRDGDRVRFGDVEMTLTIKDEG
jgi:hypothetical protein